MAVVAVGLAGSEAEQEVRVEREGLRGAET